VTYTHRYFAAVNLECSVIHRIYVRLILLKRVEQRKPEFRKVVIV
jgi:hypothetical protein